MESHTAKSLVYVRIRNDPWCHDTFLETSGIPSQGRAEIIDHYLFLSIEYRMVGAILARHLAMAQRAGT